MEPVTSTGRNRKGEGRWCCEESVLNVMDEGESSPFSLPSFWFSLVASALCPPSLSCSCSFQRRSWLGSRAFKRCLLSPSSCRDVLGESSHRSLSVSPLPDCGSLQRGARSSPVVTITSSFLHSSLSAPPLSQSFMLSTQRSALCWAPL